MKDKYPDLAKIAFPGKKTFHNMDRAVLERRKRMLGAYMQELCQPGVLATHSGLRCLLMRFLEQGEYDRAALGGVVSNTVSFHVKWTFSCVCCDTLNSAKKVFPGFKNELRAKVNN